MQFEVRLFAENDQTVVEQLFSLDRDETGRLRLVYDSSGGPDGPVPATTENGQAVPVEYRFLDGEVTSRPIRPGTSVAAVTHEGLLPDDECAATRS